MNAQINYERGGWEAGLFVRNVFDEDYILDRGLGTFAIRAGEPRTFGVFAQRNF